MLRLFPARAGNVVSVSLLLSLGTESAFAEPIEAPSLELKDRIEQRGETRGRIDVVDAGAAQASEPSSTDSSGLSNRATRRVEEIVVRARRRNELLEDTPVSITALGETTLRESGVTRLDEIQDLVPNLQFTAARNLESTVRIRGVGTSTGEIAFDPGVGIYVDGVFLPRSFGGIIDVLDVQQIEVLRGPQGTLFGKNTVGGAINITTIKPTDEFEGFAFLRPGSIGTLDARAMMNIPVVRDRVFARLAFGSQHDAGYFENTFRNQGFSNRDSLSFLGSLRLLPIENVTIDVSGSWSRQHTEGRGGECLTVVREGLGSLVPGFYDACDESKPFEGSPNVAQILDVQSYGTWGTMQWDAGDLGPLTNVQVKSLTSWRQQKPRRRDDLDMTEFQMLQLSNTGGNVLDGAGRTQEQISQEFQINGDAIEGTLDYVAGAFLFWENGTDVSVTQAIPSVLNSVTEGTTSIDNFTWALFGQATWSMTEWASLTGGIRYTSDEKELRIINRDPRSDARPTIDDSNSKTFNAWTPMGSLALTLPETLMDGTPLDHLMGYFTYSRGFKGGGFNGVINPQAEELLPFGPETLDMFELGLKTISIDQRLTLNLSAFYGNYEDLQVTVLRVVEDSDSPTGIQTLRETLNAGSATTKGIEAEFLAIPFEGAQIRGSLGYLDARYDEFESISDRDGTPINRAGQKFIGVPDLQSYLSAQYSFPVEIDGPPWLDGWLTPRLDWTYNAAVNWAGVEVPQATQRGYNLLHARLSYDFLDNRAQIALWGRNLMDESYFNYVSPFVSTFGNLVRYYMTPRTYGAELSYRFG